MAPWLEENLNAKQAVKLVINMPLKSFKWLQYNIENRPLPQKENYRGIWQLKVLNDATSTVEAAGIRDGEAILLSAEVEDDAEIASLWSPSLIMFEKAEM